MSAPATAKPIRVLLVEDNPGDARLIFEMLRDVQGVDFDLIQVDRLEPALERLSGAAMDVVLLDLGLPDSQGLATFERTRLGTTTEPIIVISGLDDQELALEAVRSGAQDYLVKGRIEGHMLARVIRYAIERQRTETQLRWLTLAVDQSPASVFITDPRGTIQYVNQRFPEITGYSAAEAIGKTPRILKSGLTPPEHYHKLWTTIQAGETWRAEIQNRRKSGELYWDAVTVSPIRDQRGEIAHFLAVQEDITGRKQIEQSIRDSEERFRQLADNIAEVFFVMDAVSWQTLYANQAYELVWGRSVQSLLERPGSFLDPLPTEDRDRLTAYVTAIIQGERPGEIEYRVVRPNGEERWLLTHAAAIRNERGEIYRVSGVALDITERKRAERALRDSELYYRTILENIGDAVFIADATGRFLDVNPRACELTGYGRDELLLLDVADTYPPAERERARSRIGEMTHTAPTVRERPLLRKDGVVLTVETNTRVLPDGRLLGTVRDITQRRQAEEALRDSERRLRTLFETVNLIVLGLDVDGNVDYVNPFFLRLTGYESAEVLRKSWFQFLPEQQRPALHVVFRDLLERDFPLHYENPIVMRIRSSRNPVKNG